MFNTKYIGVDPIPFPLEIIHYSRVLYVYICLIPTSSSLKGLKNTVNVRILTLCWNQPSTQQPDMRGLLWPNINIIPDARSSDKSHKLMVIRQVRQQVVVQTTYSLFTLKERKIIYTLLNLHRYQSLMALTVLLIFHLLPLFLNLHFVFSSAISEHYLYYLHSISCYDLPWLHQNLSYFAPYSYLFSSVQ